MEAQYGTDADEVRAAAVDAESEEAGEFEGEEEDEEDGELEEGILGGQSTFERKAIAALAWCGEGSVGVHAAAAIEDGEENDDEVAFAFGGKGGSLSSSSADTNKKKRKRKKQMLANERSGDVPVSASDASAMRSPNPGR